MSAEAHHGHEHGHDNSESAVDELMSGIGKVVNSVRVGIRNLWKGIKETIKDFAEGGSNGHDAHAAAHVDHGHGGGHDAHADHGGGDHGGGHH